MPIYFDMQRRACGRFGADVEITVTDIASPQYAATGRITDISQSGISVELPFDFAAGTIVKLRLADCCLFGHVVHSHREASCFKVGIEVVRVLIGESDLAHLLNSMLAEALPSTPGVKALHE